MVRVSCKAGFEAAVKEGSFDLILSDYMVPGFPGPAALALAREQCPEVPFLFVSGAIGDEVAVESLKSGATDYVLKDRIAKLVPSIRRALEEAEERARHKQVAEELRRGEEKYRNLVERTPAIVYSASRTVIGISGKLLAGGSRFLAKPYSPGRS